MRYTKQRAAFTLIELLVVIAIIAILVALLLPAVQQVREAARKSQCQDHLHNLVIGLHSYEGTHKLFPPGACDGMGATFNAPTNMASRFAWPVFILPYIEQKPLYDVFMARARPAGAGLPSPWTPTAGLWRVEIDLFMCPSDLRPESTQHLTTPLSYKASVGDLLNNNRDATRGVFGFRSRYGMRDILDGTSNTILLAEQAMGTNDRSEVIGGVMTNVTGETPEACWAALDPNDKARLRTDGTPGPVRESYRAQGSSAWHSLWGYVATVMPPNAPSCVSANNGDNGWGHFTASSRHPGGAQVVMGDAKVAFISENVDAGSRTATAPSSTSAGGKSPFGIWGALGTRSGGESARVP